ncbi:MAG: Dabb family protein [Ruminococcaceae bacterium]|nr:Dabb family protein [Oscillospiraceae bacterium]
MIKHIIIWNLKDSITTDEKQNIKVNAKKNLEALVGKIDGLIDLKVEIDFLPTSNGEMMLDSTFENFDALKGYAIHPAHQAVANEFVRPYTSTRSCVDFEI